MVITAQPALRHVERQPVAVKEKGKAIRHDLRRDGPLERRAGKALRPRQIDRHAVRPGGDLAAVVRIDADKVWNSVHRVPFCGRDGA